jgi:hypothetical protein
VATTDKISVMRGEERPRTTHHGSNIMAEPTDRPAPTSAPAYVAAPEPQRPNDPQLYRPLALSALVGFSLTVLYTLFLLLFTLVALLRRTPLLLGPVALVVPLVTLAICAVGWLQVRRSEGTKAGGSLALWGLLLSLLTGLSYGAYSFASSLAVSQQAQPFALDWFDKLKNGKLEDAFRLTLEPSRRPREGPNLRSELELRFNASPDGSGRGQFYGFTQGDLPRFCQLGGAATTVTPLGINEWLYQDGGYRLRQTFQVSTAEGTFQVLVSMHGIDSQGGQGRQWRIVYDETKLLQVPTPTALGTRMIDLRRSSTSFLRQWVQKVGEGKLDEAYLETRPVAERGPARTTFERRLDIARLAAAFAPGSGGPDADPEGARLLLLPGYRAYSEGSLVHLDPEKFLAPDAARAEVPAEVKKLFALPAVPPPTFQAEQVRNLLWSKDTQHVRVYHDYQVLLFPKYVAGCMLVVEGDVRSVDDTTVDPGWRLSVLELRRGGVMTGPPGMPMRPRPGT